MSHPVLEFYRPLPPLSYLPLIIIWFGIDELPKVLLIYLSCFGPLALAARAGMKSATQEQLHAAASMGASRWQLIRHVIAPAALPEILVGMRIAIGMPDGRRRQTVAMERSRITAASPASPPRPVLYLNRCGRTEGSRRTVDRWTAA